MHSFYASEQYPADQGKGLRMADFIAALDSCPWCAGTARSGILCVRCRRADDQPPLLPDHEWWSGDIRQALATRDLGKAIRAYRRHPHHGRRPIPQEDMARWLSITQGHLSRIEQGKVPVNNLDTLSSYARVLGIPPSLLWFDIPTDPYTRPATVPTRRSTVLPQQLSAAIDTPADIPLADALLSTLTGHSARDQLAGPHEVLDAVRNDLTFIDRRLTTIADSEGRSRLQYVAGRYAEFLGWLHQDCGDLPAAAHWSSVALTYASSVEDPRFSAYVLMRSSNIATDSGKLSNATALVQQALSHAGALTPRQHAVLLRQHAIVAAARAARTGAQSDREACASALARAAEAAAEPIEEPDGLAGYCSPVYVAMEAAHCWIELGNPEKATEILEQRLGDWQAGSRRDLGMGLARLSTAYAGVGCWEEAVEFAGYTATILADTGSHRTLKQLHATQALLRAAGHPDAARELTHQVRTAHRARPATVGAPSGVDDHSQFDRRRS